MTEKNKAQKYRYVLNKKLNQRGQQEKDLHTFEKLKMFLLSFVELLKTTDYSILFVELELAMKQFISNLQRVADLLEMIIKGEDLQGYFEQHKLIKDVHGVLDFAAEMIGIALEEVVGPTYGLIMIKHAKQIHISLASIVAYRFKKNDFHELEKQLLDPELIEGVYD